MRVPDHPENVPPSGASFRLKPRWAWALTAPGIDRVVGEEPDLGAGVFASDVCEISHGLNAPFSHENCAVLQWG